MTADTSTATAARRRRQRGRAIGLLVLRRMAFAIPVLLVVSFAVFALAKASPFDPVEQYWNWLRNAVSGDLGDSLSLQQPVSTVIAERLGWSMLLVSVSFPLALLIGLVLGTAATWRTGGWLDRAVTGVSYALEAAPVFWLGLAALYVFALALHWLPGGGVSDPNAGMTLAQVARHLVLPASVLAISQAPWFVLFVRQTLLEALTQDYVTGARARGLPDRTVVVRHALRTSLLPFLTLLGARIPELITGALLVETVFLLAGGRQGHRGRRARRRLRAAGRADAARDGCGAAGRRAVRAGRPEGGPRWLSSPGGRPSGRA
jgi:peptide/nickel transport system permease protein